MASENKKNKLKNGFLHYAELKNKFHKLKRSLFYTASQRKFDKKINLDNE